MVKLDEDLGEVLVGEFDFTSKCVKHKMRFQIVGQIVNGNIFNGTNVRYEFV